MNLNMEKMVEKLNKLGVDIMGIQIKMAVVDRVMSKQKEIEKALEEGKQNQEKLSSEIKHIHTKVDNVNDKIETVTALVEKTRSTVAKKIKKLKTEGEEWNNTTRSSFEEQENVNKMMNLKLNENKIKIQEMEDQVVAMELMRQEMNERVETMDMFIKKNDTQLNKINEQVEENKQMALNAERSAKLSTLMDEQNVHLKPEIDEEFYKNVNSKLKILRMENKKLLTNQKTQTLQVLEDKNKFPQMQKIISGGNPVISGFDVRNYYETHRDQTECKWRITNLNATENIEHTSQVFELRDHGISAQAKLYYASRRPNLEICFINQENSKKLIKILPKIYFVLRDQKNTKDVLLKSSYSYMHQQPIQFDHYYNLGVSNLHLEFPNFVSDLSIELDLFSKPPSTAEQIYSYNGILYWLIENYSRRLSLATTSPQSRASLWPCESPYFFTDAGEYRVQCIMHVDESQSAPPSAHHHNFVYYTPEIQKYVMSNVLLNAEIVFFPGELDAKSFTTHYHKTTITIFNVKNPKAHIVGNLEGDIQQMNRSSIMLKSNGNMSDFIQNDILFYKVCVELCKKPP